MESEDVAARFPQHAAKLRATLDAWLAEIDADFPVANPNFDPEAFRRRTAEISGTRRERREQQAAMILQPGWQPDPTWWGSDSQAKVDILNTSPGERDPLLDWHRPVDANVFTSVKGNNHDSILFHEPETEYPYKLIISHTPDAAHLWRAKVFSWSSEDWELVSDRFKIGKHYEYDDGVKVDGVYYIFESGQVFTYSGQLEESNGKWMLSGAFPQKECDDLGVFYEDGMFHIFGEYGDFPHGPDGTSLAHFTSETGLGDWKLVNPKAVDPNPDGGHAYGVGDPTIEKIGDHYYIFCDRESVGSPYKVTAWRSASLYEPFDYIGKAITPRSDEVDDWDNYRIQDPDILYVPELGRYVMSCNMMDKDGNPGGQFPSVKGGGTRVIGLFYSANVE